MKKGFNGVCTETKKKLFYFNPMETNSIYQFCNDLFSLIQENHQMGQSIILLCIGSDRATGDSLGPIIGYKLSRINFYNLPIYGTLSHPVHAKNLSATLDEIYEKYTNPFIIAVDASLGNDDHIGYVTLGLGSLYPGIGVDKDLPSVGNIFITGIVNISGMLNQILLQTTRLDLVMRLADYICVGLRYSIYQIDKNKR